MLQQSLADFELERRLLPPAMRAELSRGAPTS
jgi:hypothetical protein